jgi:peptidoglycan L-alanyl-D-glutamate endopeptidase CwlK
VRGLELLHPELRAAAGRFLAECAKRGLNTLITDTWRTKAEQDGLYAQGRTAPGNIVTNARYLESPHCWGVAFDFCRNRRGREFDNTDGFFDAAGRLLNELRAELGLFWGGDFKNFVDRPHAEMIRFMPGCSTAWLIRAYGTPERFLASWPAWPPDGPGEEAGTVVIYRTLADVPDWGQDTVKKLTGLGWLEGDGGALDLSHDMLRVLVINDRAGLYE